MDFGQNIRLVFYATLFLAVCFTYSCVKNLVSYKINWRFDLCIFRFVILMDSIDQDSFKKTPIGSWVNSKERKLSLHNLKKPLSSQPPSMRRNNAQHHEDIKKAQKKFESFESKIIRNPTRFKIILRQGNEPISLIYWWLKIMM